MRLEQCETELMGKWVVKDGHVEGDVTENRISWLTRNALRRIAFTSAGYDILYQDPGDGRYWELTFPHPQGFGVGPQKLSHLEKQSAVKKYKLDDFSG
jgi:hypothetical protein